MTTLEKAARQALDALEHSSIYHFDRKRNDEALDALRAALTQQAEPVVDRAQEQSADGNVISRAVQAEPVMVSDHGAMVTGWHALLNCDCENDLRDDAIEALVMAIHSESERQYAKKQAEPVVERRPAGWVKQQTVPMDGLVSDVEYLRLFEEARNGSDRASGVLRGIRAVIAAYEDATPKQAEPVVEPVQAGWTQMAGWVCDYCGPGLMCAPCLIAKQQAEPVVERAQEQSADGNVISRAVQAEPVARMVRMADGTIECVAIVQNPAKQAEPMQAEPVDDDCTPNHLCAGRWVHKPADEICNGCGHE
jgi:aerobic-type carbon monoxide dehydrogenase small subunit (CoxS/CutS family)